MAKEILVVKELVNSITTHSLELQRLANTTQGHLSREFAKLGKELDSIASEFDASSKMNVRNRKIAQVSIIKKGEAAIRRSTAAMQTLVHNDLIDIGNLEAKFSLGSLNRAVTGTGTIKFATTVVPAKTISNVAENLIIKGAPQKALWARQSVAIQNKFRDAIKESWLNNETIGQTRQRIRGTQANRFKDGILNTSRHHADSLARTSISSVANQVRQETYIANSDVVEGVQFLAVLDDSTTPICRDHSNNSWKYTSAGWKNMSGGQDYRRPPLHFNCRSTLIPLVYPADVLAKTVPAKMAKVPKDRARTMGKPLPRKAEFNNFDAWLAAQSVSKQKNVMGSQYSLWKDGEISAIRVASQKGRYLTTDELIAKYEAKKIIPKESVALKSKETFKPNATADKEYQELLRDTTKGEFFKIQQQIIAGKQLDSVTYNKMGAILRNADPADLLYGNEFNPALFQEFLGTKADRLAFYNHTAKRFEQSRATLAKGDLERRLTDPLNEVDREILNELHERILKTTLESNRKIMLQMFDEASLIVGTKRTLPMMESLLSLSNKVDFSHIAKDKFVAYINNALNNSVNSYFGRVTRLEARFSSSLTKVEKYNAFSESSKKFYSTEITKDGGISLAEASAIKKKLEKLGKRNLRYFEGENLTALTVDMELPMRQNISLYLKYLADDIRMNDDQIIEFINRVSFHSRMTKAQELNAKRVQYILSLDDRATKDILSDKILGHKLFKGWGDAVWKGKGLSTDMKKEIGQVLQDVKTYQNLKKYVSNRSGTELFEDVMRGARKVSTAPIERELDRLLDLNAKARKKVILEREAKVVTNISKDGEFAVIERAKAKASRDALVKKERAEAEIALQTETDSNIVFNMAQSLDDLAIKHHRKSTNSFYNEAKIIQGDDISKVELAKLINKTLFDSVQSGKPYVNTAKSLGSKYYRKYRSLTNVDEDELIRMGHFLIESAVKTKIVKRVKMVTTIVEDGRKSREVLTWRLQEVNENWKQYFLANKNNYDVDGLPSIGKAPKFGKDGIYAGDSQSPVIRGVDKKWLKEQAEKPSAKPWLDNLAIESQTPIKINGYIFDVMEELEKLGKSAIPRKGRKGDKVARSKYDSYIRAKEMARGLRDEKFYNRMSNDKFARTYADTTALQWQGDDINRGLMMFDHGVKMGVTGEADFARNFMNLAGFDKLPMKTRIKLFKQIDEDLLIRTAKDPIKNDWWYTQNNWETSGVFKNLKVFDKKELEDILKLAKRANPADEGAFQFLAMIKERSEMIKWTQSGKKIDDFVSYLPSQRDGTTNVLQHFAAISRDKTIAKAVNMTATDEVSDAYIGFREALERMAEKMGADDELRKLILLDSDMKYSHRRKSVKKGLMTSQYNAGAKTIGESYQKELAEYYDIIRNASPANIKKLGAKMLEAAEDEFPQATRVRHLLNDMAEAHQIAGVDAIEFTTPYMQFPFRQSYNKTGIRQIELIDSAGKKMKLNVQTVLDDIDFQKQNRAFAPNIIHSMDATHKSLVVEILKKKYNITDFSMIHDSFGTHFGKMDLLSKVTKEAFLMMYKDQNFMKTLAKQFEANGVPMVRYKLKDGKKVRDAVTKEFELEPIPLDDILGEYDFEDFMELEYFFH